MKRIVLMASGSGSNVENIVRYFKDKPEVKIQAVLTNRRNAFVIDRCKALKVGLLYFNREAYGHSDLVENVLKCMDPDLIVLAGFLWKIPESMVRTFRGRIINIHPALLPKYGGKGMYGRKVHETVKAEGESETGITIHFVNEYYDEGQIIFQAKVKIKKEDSVEAIASKVQDLEYQHFPQVIDELLTESDG